MFRTVKVKLAGDIEPLVHTATMYTQACQVALDYGFKNKTHNKNKINAGTYMQIREKIPRLPSGLVQCARDQAAEMLKRERLRRLSTKKKMQIRYDKRTFKFYPDGEYVSLSTVIGRMNFPVNIYKYMRQYLHGKFTNAQLVVRKGKVFLNIQCKLPDKQPHIESQSVLGIDRGIMNIVTCSDNSFANSSHLRKVKGHYQYLKAKLQSIGTASAIRKLKKLSGAERRFTLDVNHVLAKEIVQKPYDVFAVEALRIGRRKIHGRRFNRMLGGWSYGQLLTMLTYKSENIGKRIVQVNPRHTSQRCSKCGYIDKQNRKGLKFKCKQCGFELNADLNAARNIGEIGKSELVRLSVNQPIVAHTGTTATSPQALAVGS